MIEIQVATLLMLLGGSSVVGAVLGGIFVAGLCWHLKIRHAGDALDEASVVELREARLEFAETVGRAMAMGGP